MPRDFHIHSGLIQHTNDSVLALVRRAKELGFSEITILEHISPFKIANPGSADQTNTIFIDRIPSEYTRRTSTVAVLLEQCTRAEQEVGIKINKSLEVDYSKDFEPEIAGYRALGFDYLTLSSHYLEDADAVSPDRKFIHIGFEENVAYMLETYGEDGLIDLYFANQLNGITSGLFKVVAHLDFFGRYLKNYTSAKIIGRIDPILREIIARDMLLEINLAKEFPLPGIEILKRYRELGGDKTCLSSDAHSVADLEQSMKRRARVLREISVDIE